MSGKATYPLKGGKMIHIHKGGERKNLCQHFIVLSTYYNNK